METSDNYQFYGLSDTAILRQIGKFIKQRRLKKNYSQAHLAQIAGINRGTLVDIEQGRSTSLITFIQLLRSLDELTLLQTFAPMSIISPLQVAEAEAKQRKRAGRAKNKGTFNKGPSQW